MSAIRIGDDVDDGIIDAHGYRVDDALDGGAETIGQAVDEAIGAHAVRYPTSEAVLATHAAWHPDRECYVVELGATRPAFTDGVWPAVPLIYLVPAKSA